MAATRRMVLWGATGQARVLRECMQSAGVELVAVFDNDAGVASPFPDVPIHHGVVGYRAWLREEQQVGDVGFLVAIGGERGRDRLEIQEMMERSGLCVLTARHPSAFIASSAVVGAGAQILAHATVCVDVTIGRGAIVNTAASVDHECVVGDGAHLCPGVRVAGCVTIGAFATLGTGAVVLPRVRIGEGAVVGAGAVVLRDVDPRAVVVGNPARLVGTRS
jgi:sugar O-acyltransferase (sialic acid O-acetyltransferase NeuD family)